MFYVELKEWEHLDPARTHELKPWVFWMPVTCSYQWATGTVCENIPSILCSSGSAGKSIWPPFRRPRFESSLASHTLLREEVSGHAATIELPPQQKLAVINEVCALHRLHLLLWSSNYVTCLADVSISLSNRSVWYFKLQSMHGDNSSAAAWPDPSFLQRVWLARLGLNPRPGWMSILLVYAYIV